MKIDRIPSRSRASFLSGLSGVCAVALLSGCMSSPTYGTGKTANAQLLEDLTGVVSTGALINSQSRGSEIAYTPRAELVRPASLELLPEPQQGVVTADNPAWPESPEARRARIRAEATENRDNPGFRPAVAMTPVEAAEDVERRAGLRQPAERQPRQGEAHSRRYLTEPPVAYRVPSDTAPVGELGEDEWKKQQAGRRASGKTSWRDYIPGL